MVRTGNINTGHPTPLENGYVEHSVRVTITGVSATESARQLTELLDGVAWIIKDIEAYFPDAVGPDGYVDLNTASTNTAATRFGSRFYQTGSFIHLTGDVNGVIGSVLTAKPYLHLSSGTGGANQTVYVTVTYYVKTS